MGLLDLFRPRFRLVIGDCSSRSVSRVNQFPVSLSGKSNDGTASPICRIDREGKDFIIEPADPEKPVRLDGNAIDGYELLLPDRTYGISLDGHLIVVRIGRGSPHVDDSFFDERWDIAPKSLPLDRETLPRSELNARSLASRYPTPHEMLAFPMPGDACFTLPDLIGSLEPVAPAASANRPHPTGRTVPKPAPAPPHRRYAPRRSATGVHGQRPCPCCWKPFAAGEALSIAAHDALTGDPILGSHAKLRFAAESFNELGQALDAEGAVSVDLACPHCRGRLPPSFFAQEQLILSLVGAPSSGKSYFLSVLLRLLPEECIRHFGANLQDGDPSGNAQLNEMKNRLFSATTPEDAFISKTDFEGIMYERLYRNGKLVPLPRPFVYYLQRFDSPNDRASLVFYDNAGEHFKPGVSLDDSPGALHVAASAGLIFLFDPTTNRSFRQQLIRKRDPQLRTQATDEQDTILSELGVRVKKMRGLESHERVDTPLAIVVGKFDLWQNLVEPEAITVPEEERPLTESEIAGNSATVRSLLARLCPTIVANAESISSNVMYFPASPLGHSPKEIEEGPLAGRLAPNPRRLKPILATTPALWAISQAAPGLLQSRAAAL